MKRTGPVVLVIAALLGGGAGFLVNQLLAAARRATFTPTISLPILLLLLGAVLIALALPIRRATRGATSEPVNPFRALRIAMLAKASSIVGAVVGGFAVGLIVFLLTRMAGPSLGSMGEIIATALSGALLIAAGLIAEHLCTIPKDDDDEHPGADDAGIRTHDH